MHLLLNSRDRQMYPGQELELRKMADRSWHSPPKLHPARLYSLPCNIWMTKSYRLHNIIVWHQCIPLGCQCCGSVHGHVMGKKWHTDWLSFFYIKMWHSVHHCKWYSTKTNYIYNLFSNKITNLASWRVSNLHSTQSSFQSLSVCVALQCFCIPACVYALPFFSQATQSALSPVINSYIMRENSILFVFCAKMDKNGLESTKRSRLLWPHHSSTECRYYYASKVFGKTLWER